VCTLISLTALLTFLTSYNLHKEIASTFLSADAVLDLKLSLCLA